MVLIDNGGRRGRWIESMKVVFLIYIYTMIMLLLMIHGYIAEMLDNAFPSLPSSSFA